MQKTQIALFPLQIFLLPKERTRLHIFEERYKQLLEDCKGPGTLFGIPYTPNGMIAKFGCIVEVSKVIREHHNGSADIEVRCVDLFRLEHFMVKMEDKLYPGGEVTTLDASERNAVSKALVHRLDKYVQEVEPHKMEEVFSAQLNVYDVARILELEEDDKIKLFASASSERQEQILGVRIEMLYAMHAQKNSVQGQLFLN
jgi:Lon protease-like protein